MKIYRSPISIIQKEINEELENNVYKAVMKCDITVNKEELIKALKYDRNQYDIGYQDGVRSVWNKIANLKDEINRGFDDILGEE